MSLTVKAVKENTAGIDTHQRREQQTFGFFPLYTAAIEKIAENESHGKKCRVRTFQEDNVIGKLRVKAPQPRKNKGIEKRVFRLIGSGRQTNDPIACSITERFCDDNIDAVIMEETQHLLVAAPNACDAN
jgi:hypothetical protein